MGMDTVELVMEFEDAFDTRISDNDAERLQTIGDTVNWLVADLKRRTAMGAAPRENCQSAHNFYALRRSLMSGFGVPRDVVRPDALIGELIPDSHERRRWRQFANDNGLPVPPFSLFKSKRFPRAKTTVRDLVQRIWPGEFVTADGEVDRHKVLETVCFIVSQQLDVPMKDLHWRTHYINDLNAN